MKTKNLIVLSMLATLLVCTVFASIANADTGTATASVPPSKSVTGNSPNSPRDVSQPEPLPESAGPDSAVSSGDAIPYTAQNQNSTIEAGDTLVPGAGETNLVSAQVESGDDEIWVVLGIMAVLGTGLGSVVGVVLYRRVPIKS